MNNTKNIMSVIRRVSSILLLIFSVIQIVVVLSLATEIAECEMEDIHEPIGFIFLGLTLIHILVYWKSLKTLFLFKKSNI